MSLIADIADAVVTGLNTPGLLPSGIQAVRAYRATFELKEMDTLHVTVVPRGVELSNPARVLAQSDVQIDIGVQQRVGPPEGEAAEIDGLMDQVEKIIDFVRETRRFGNAVWLRTQNVPIYAPEHLSELRQFTSVITLTFVAIQT